MRPAICTRHVFSRCDHFGNVRGIARLLEHHFNEHRRHLVLELPELRSDLVALSEQSRCIRAMLFAICLMKSSAASAKAGKPNRSVTGLTEPVPSPAAKPPAKAGIVPGFEGFRFGRALSNPLDSGRVDKLCARFLDVPVQGCRNQASQKDIVASDRRSCGIDQRVEFFQRIGGRLLVAFVPRDAHARGTLHGNRTRTGKGVRGCGCAVLVRGVRAQCRRCAAAPLLDDVCDFMGEQPLAGGRLRREAIRPEHDVTAERVRIRMHRRRALVRGTVVVNPHVG